jgi:uncharacterized protein (DUF924 family)
MESFSPSLASVAADVSMILDFWFGPQPFAWRADLWFYSSAECDAFITRQFSPLWDALPSNDELMAAWLQNSRSNVALVLLFDFLPQIAFRGQPRAFQDSARAQAIARQTLDRDGVSLPWPHRLFLNLSLLNAEDQAQAAYAANDYNSLLQGLEMDASNITPEAHSSVIRFHHVVKSRLRVLTRFGRFPHLNKLLSRTDTNEETAWLRNKNKLPSWAKPAKPLILASAEVKQKPPSLNLARVLPRVSLLPRRRLRFLILHGNKTVLSLFKKQTESALDELGECVYASAPHRYDGDTKIADGADARCWWNTRGDGPTMIYEGLALSVTHVTNLLRNQGPFDGLIGFSQGAAMGAILIAMNEGGLLDSPLGDAAPKCFVSISGFYCRDVRPPFSTLHVTETPVVHSPASISLRLASLSIPSFHVWGTMDQLMENWRSEALASVFANKTIQTHPGGHLKGAVNLWPISSMTTWLSSLESMQKAIAAESPAALPFETRLSRLLQHTARTSEAARRPSNQDFKQQHYVYVIGEPTHWLTTTALCNDLFWTQCRASQPLQSPQDITQSLVDEYVVRMWATHSASQGDVLVEDLMLVAWSLFPYVPANYQLAAADKHHVDTSGQVFFWMVLDDLVMFIV